MELFAPETGAEKSSRNDAVAAKCNDAVSAFSSSSA